MLANMPALVLNADFRPKSLFPLSVISWHDSVKAVYEGTHAVVAEYDVVVRSPSIEMRLPSVLAVRQFVRPVTRVSFSVENLILRDRHRCQYCGEATRKLTKDHVHPRSRGGPDTWENVVMACDPCNSRKGDSVDVMHPMKVPREPTPTELMALQRAQQRMHPTWLEYLPEAA